MSPLLNYTTEVPVARTIGHVQAILVAAGARSISVEYGENGEATGMAFQVETAYGLRRFMIPVNADAVTKVLCADKKVQRRYQTHAHGQRVAWRIVKDWLEAQLAIIDTEMVTLDQVMLPYMADASGRTVYELYRDQQLQLALPEGEGEE